MFDFINGAANDVIEYVSRANAEGFVLGAGAILAASAVWNYLLQSFFGGLTAVINLIRQDDIDDPRFTAGGAYRPMYTYRGRRYNRHDAMLGNRYRELVDELVRNGSDEVVVALASTELVNPINGQVLDSDSLAEAQKLSDATSGAFEATALRKEAQAYIDFKMRALDERHPLE